MEREGVSEWAERSGCVSRRKGVSGKREVW